MKRINSILLTACLASVALVSCKSGPATLTGEIKDYKAAGVECMLITDSAFVQDSVDIADDGSFVYSRDFPEGAEIWFVSEDARGFLRLYLKNGDKQHIVLAANADSIIGRCEVTFSGDTKATEYFRAFDKDFANPTKWTPKEAAEYQSFKSFKAALDSVAGKLATQLEATGDKRFIAKEEKKLKDKILITSFSYMRGRQQAGLPTDEDKDFLTFVESIDYNDMENAKNRLTDMYIGWYQASHPHSTSGPGVQYLTILKKRVSNQEVIDYMADGYMARYMEDGADAYLAPTFATYQQTTSSQEKIKKFQKMRDDIGKLLPGNVAPDFAIKDVKGNSLKFSDVIGKGKITYMDVWATWCGPCCAEIPFMEKLAEHYAGNSKIEIISISIDEKQDKWKKKLEADKPEWRQFIVPDGFKSELCREYKISGIPRFMLFDKDGQIINVNAPRPSDDSIISYLDSLLK
ncbi:TlpA disulfide reductase family protein [uncultured Bacteroides sp.]|uniref:TlpA family protein disulfide reductase n=1 Tax=uncultured Bacteroides sp. TaxID=162156 RepID=UPI0025EE2FB7|nr:TlpA disulfide reductase family protein [uncultured Bacteroides sp.]